MAYRFEKTTTSTDIVMDGFENGIADSPFQGIGDMRNVNIISVPQEGSVNFATSAMNIPPTVSAVAFTVDAGTDTFTVANTTNFYNGMAITFNSIVTATGFSTGRVYWIGNLTATTFKIYSSPSLILISLINVTLSGSGTYSSYTLSQPLDKAIFYSAPSSAIRNYVFILDDTGKVWWVQNTGGSLTTNLIYLGNDTLTGTTGRAISLLDNYLIVFRTSSTDYLQVQNIENGTDLDSGSGWVYGWEGVSSVVENPRPTLSGIDNALYYGNSGRVGSILINTGSNFDPGNSATYTKSVNALDINNDQVTALGFLGTNLLVGGLLNYIYPWDRISTGYKYPIILAENYTSKIVTANSTAYVFAGNRGRIYETNGSNVDLFKKVPDSITSSIDPYFAWGDVVYWKNQIYFSFTATTNAGVAINTVAGVWAIDLSTNSLRYVNQLSYGTYNGTTTVLVQNVLTTTPGGSGLYIGWVNSGAYGVDVTTSIPYTGGQSYIDFDLIPVGTFLTKKTFQNVEWKLSTPLVSGESISIYYRINITDAFSLLGTTNTAGLLSDQPYPVNFEMSQWLQLRSVLTSTASIPSLVRLREIRLR